MHPGLIRKSLNDITKIGRCAGPPKLRERASAGGSLGARQPIRANACLNVRILALCWHRLNKHSISFAPVASDSRSVQLLKRQIRFPTQEEA